MYVLITPRICQPTIFRSSLQQLCNGLALSTLPGPVAQLHVPSIYGVRVWRSTFLAHRTGDILNQSITVSRSYLLTATIYVLVAAVNGEISKFSQRFSSVELVFCL
jgi:hypothetical protein